MTELPTVESKQCSKCHIEKPAAEFDRYKRTADGLQSQCKICMKVHKGFSSSAAALFMKYSTYAYWLGYRTVPHIMVVSVVVLSTICVIWGIAHFTLHRCSICVLLALCRQLGLQCQSRQSQRRSAPSAARQNHQGNSSASSSPRMVCRATARCVSSQLMYLLQNLSLLMLQS